MTKKQLLKPTRRMAIHAKTQAQATQLMKWYRDKGMQWIMGIGAMGSTGAGIGNWGAYKKDTCYSHKDWMKSEGTHHNLEYFKKEGYEIITVKEFFDIMGEKKINKEQTLIQQLEKATQLFAERLEKVEEIVRGLSDCAVINDHAKTKETWEDRFRKSFGIVIGGDMKIFFQKELNKQEKKFRKEMLKAEVKAHGIGYRQGFEKEDPNC